MKEWSISSVLSLALTGCIAAYVIFLNWGIAYTQNHIPELIVPLSLAFVFFTVVLRILVYGLNQLKKQTDDVKKRVLVDDINKQEMLGAVSKVVKQTLKAPLTAVFCDPDELTVFKNVDGTYLVKGHVNSQNSYGAMIKTDFSVKLRQKGKEWQSIV